MPRRMLHPESLNDQVTVVIRSVGERTEAACIDAVVAQGVDRDAIVVVRKSPFSLALRTGLEAGIAAGRPWTFCIDADVILRPGAVAAVLAHARRQPETVAVVQALLLDKLTLTIRCVGIHFYRTTLLPKALALIPSEGDAIRPENTTIKALAAGGNPMAVVPYVAGIHDFGQYNRDIYRKCFVHAHKHLDRIPELVPYWRAHGESDPDFRVALEGAAAGLREAGTVYIDTRFKPVAEGFAASGIIEREAMVPGELDPDRILAAWADYPEVRVSGLPVSPREAVAFTGESRLPRVAALSLLRRKAGSIGLIRALPYSIGAGIEQVGRRIKALTGE
jgi:hypothetical protein